VAQIDGFRVRNYRSLRDVTIGRLFSDQSNQELTKLIAVIGKNGSGKSTLLDAFGFISDCLSLGVEPACDQHQRGGFERLRSRGVEDPVSFDIYYREAPGQRPITYELARSTSIHPVARLLSQKRCVRGDAAKVMAGRFHFFVLKMDRVRFGQAKMLSISPRKNPICASLFI
jgi:predicted ATPase